MSEVMSRTVADAQVRKAFERHCQGDLQHSYEVYRQVLRQFPEHARALHFLGLIAQQSGRSQDAVQLLERSLAIDPGDAHALNHLGAIRLEIGDRRGAAQCFERAIIADPEHPEALNNCANLAKTRDLHRAISLYRRALTVKPDYLLATFNLALALKDDGDLLQAEELLRRALMIDARHAPTHFSLGVLLQEQARHAEAVSEYRSALSCDPSHIGALANLFANDRFQAQAATAEAAQSLLKDAGTAVDSRIKLHHGLGRHFDRVGDYAQAAEHFTASRRLARGQIPAFNQSLLVASFDRLSRQFTRIWFERHAACAAEAAPTGSQPIFVVGMPYSGVAQVGELLARHSQARLFSDLGEMAAIVKSLRPGYPECIAQMDAQAIALLRSRYLEALTPGSDSCDLRGIDATADNLTHLGLIATIFPQASIIHCVRDAADVALACFSEMYRLDRGYAVDVASTAHYHAQCARLMAHYHATLPVPVLTVSYEDALEGSQVFCRRLLAHCALQWEAQCCGPTEQVVGDLAPGHSRRYTGLLKPLYIG